jgi:hypothetical protein
MRGVAGLVLCGLLAAGSAQAADCQLKQFGSLDIAGMPNRILIPVSFGDTQKQFLLELTSSYNYISEEAANELSLKTRAIASRVPNVSIGKGGQAITRLAYAPKFQVGPFKGEDMEFLVLPQTLTEVGTAGTLGAMMFEKVDLELDAAHSKMNLFLPDHCPGKVVYWTKTGFAQLPFKKDRANHITTNMILDGLPVSVSLQTNGRSEIGMNAMRRLFKLDETAPGMSLVGTASDGQKMYRYPFKTLTADGLTVANPNILVRGEPVQEECDGKVHLENAGAAGHVNSTGDDLVICYGGPDLQLGLSVLSKLRLYISSQEKLIYATGAGAQ